MSELEETFAGQLRMLFMDRGWDQEAIAREYQFCEERNWRADFAIDGWFARYYADPRAEDVRPHILIEIEGLKKGQKSRHTEKDGYTNDSYKYSAASALGYTVLRGTGAMVHDGTLLMMTEQVLTGELNIEDWKAT